MSNNNGKSKSQGGSSQPQDVGGYYYTPDEQYTSIDRWIDESGREQPWSSVNSRGGSKRSDDKGKGKSYGSKGKSKSKK